MMGSGKGLPGGGPWRILEGCEAPKHNTLRAHAGRHGRGDRARSVRCHCPGSLALYAADVERRKRGKFRPRPVQPKPGQPTVQMRVPDLSTGLCRTPRGAALIRYWQSSTGRRQEQIAKTIVWMCERRCPVRDQCGLFVQVNEQPAGSWGNIYAGWTIADRERAAERRVAARDASKLWPCWPIADRVIRARDRSYPGGRPPLAWLCSDIARDRPPVAETAPES